MGLRPWTLPQNYAGATWEGWLVAPVTRHRDSELLEESNWAHQLKILEAIGEPEGWTLDDPPFQVVTENHWAAGWVEWVAVRPEAKEHVAALEKLAKRLDQYPILDEMDLSMREVETANETWANFSVRDRVEIIKRSGSKVSVFAARRAYVPENDDGRISDKLLGY